MQRSPTPPMTPANSCSGKSKRRELAGFTSIPVGFKGNVRINGVLGASYANHDNYCKNRYTANQIRKRSELKH